MITVVVADDQELVRTGFALILGSDPEIEVVAQAAEQHIVRRLIGRLELEALTLEVLGGERAFGGLLGALGRDRIAVARQRLCMRAA